MVDLQKLNNIKIELTDSTKEKTQAPKSEPAQDLWDDIGSEVTHSLMAQGNSKEDSEALATSYINYAAATLQEAKDGKNITFEEYSSNQSRYEFLGIDTSDPEKAKAELKDMYDAISSLDGTAGLSAKELVALAMYSDAKNSTKNDGNINLDGETRAADTPEGSNFGASKNMKDVATEEGAQLAQDLYDSTFRTEAQIRDAGETLRANFAENVKNGDITQAEVDTIVNNMMDYLTFTMKQKDIDGSSLVSQDEWLREGTGTYQALGLVDENGNPDTEAGKKLFNILDTNGDGSLDINEMVAQYLYRDFTSKGGELANLNGDNSRLNAMDGQIHMNRDGGGIARNLTTLLQVDGAQEYLKDLFSNFMGTSSVNDTAQTTTANPAGNTPKASAQAQATYDALYDAEEGYLLYDYYKEMGFSTQAAEGMAAFQPNLHKGVVFSEANSQETYVKDALDLAQAYMDKNDQGDKDNKITREEFEDALANRLRQIYGNADMGHEYLSTLTNQQIFDRYGYDANALFNIYNVNSIDDVLDLNEIAASYMVGDVGRTSNGELEFDGNINVVNYAEINSDEYQAIYNNFFPQGN